MKRDGRFRARLVACGYSQVPGVDFVESYAPVINDVTWRILIVSIEDHFIESCKSNIRIRYVRVFENSNYFALNFNYRQL